MTKIIKNTKTNLSKMERGQVLMVVAVSIVVLVAVMGLALDVGIMFIGNAKLRRAVDAAALAAALQFRQGYQFSQLDDSAVEFLRLNSISDPNALVQICDGPDPEHTIPADLCPAPTDMQRKLVRVVASGRVALAFLPVIGINNVPIAANAISETASVDVVLVIDRSESMTYTAARGTASRDPSYCNVDQTAPPSNPLWDASYVGNCEPFFDVKLAAVDFVNSLYFPYDRVSIITFDKDATKIMDFSNDKPAIINAIKGLTVYEGDVTASGPLTDPITQYGLPILGTNAIYPNGNPSRYYNPPPPPLPPTGTYLGLGCPQRDISTSPNYPDPSPCTTTNIGLGMYYAGIEFNVPPVRKNSLWVVILLTDGVANAGYDSNHSYYCPDSTWGYADSYNTSADPWVLLSVEPKCNDDLSSTRHSPDTSSNYDAEDYAMDAVDYVAVDQSALIFSIGLGPQVEAPSTLDGTPLGELFLQYAATTGDGLFYYAPDSSQLEDVFRKISSNIATRLEH